MQTRKRSCDIIYCGPSLVGTFVDGWRSQQHQSGPYLFIYDPVPVVVGGGTGGGLCLPPHLYIYDAGCNISIRDRVWR